MILGIYSFLPGCPIFGIELFIVFTYICLYFCVVSSFISDFMYLGILSFCLISLAKHVSILCYLFKEPSLGYTNRFY